MKLDSKKTALLTLDYQKGVFGFVPGSEAIIPRAARALEAARKHRFPIIHVGLGFSEGHPEIPEAHPVFGKVRQGNLFVKGSPSAEFHPSIAQAGELVLYKQRVSAFSDNALEMILRARGIEHLVLMGIATSGIVLSTLRRAFDLDFTCTVVKDACHDGDPEVHRVLTEKVFTHQATVVTAEAFAET
jgi:nicotinamidase-related amidase